VNTPEVCRTNWVRSDNKMIVGDSVRVSASNNEAANTISSVFPEPW